MACTERVITSPISGKEIISKTWSDIRALVNTEEEADKLYQQLTSPAFISWAGDWVSGNGQIQLTEDGEPLITDGFVTHNSDDVRSVFSGNSNLSPQIQAYNEILDEIHEEFF